MSFNANDNLLLSGLLPTEASRVRLGRLLDEDRARIDWAAVVRRANLHHTAALLRFNLSKIGALDLVPEEARRELEEINRTWAARHLAYVSETRRLIATLRDAGVAAIPLKGAALLIGDCYPRAGLRAALDIDLLVDPAKIDLAESTAQECGYVEIPGRRDVRPRQRLENERNHSWPRRGSDERGGLILELHHRAFHYARGGRGFSFDELRGRAIASPDGVLLPSTSNLALHLIHHTMVDLQSTHAILRTLADLHFLFAREPQARHEVEARAREFGFGGAARLADDTLRLLAEGKVEEVATREEVALLIETALIESPSARASLAEAARLFEYFDFARHPIRKIGNLLSLVFTSRSHLEQLYGRQEQGSVARNYLRRPIDLMKKFNWGSLSAANLRRVWKLRAASQSRSRD